MIQILCPSLKLKQSVNHYNYSKDCVAIGELEGREGADTYCMDECLNHNSVCPAERCRCF